MSPTNPRKILFLCGGDTRRSPIATIVLKQLLDRKGIGILFDVQGAACTKPDGTSAHILARQVIKDRYGKDLLEGYKPQQLTQSMKDEADVIVVMEDYMKAKSCLPEIKVFTLGIPDPSETIDSFRACATAIERNLLLNWTDIMPKYAIVQELEPEQPRLPQTFDMDVFLKKHGVTPVKAVDSVHNEVINIAKSVNPFGRGPEHPETVTRLMLKMYDDLASIGLLKHTVAKRNLAEAIGYSHDIGVSKGEANHNVSGFNLLKENLWNLVLSPAQMNLLSIVLYAVYYHRGKIPEGKLNPLNNIPLEDYRSAAELVSLIRIADGLDYGLVQGSPDLIEHVEMVRTTKGIECRVVPKLGKNVNNVIGKSYDKRDVFEAIFGLLTFWLPTKGGWVKWDKTIG